MNAKIIDGATIANEVRSNVAKEVSLLKEKGITPTLAVILVGSNPASVSYVTGKTKALHEAGMKDDTHKLDENTTEEELLNLIKKLNENPNINGILVQLPLPKQINADKVIATIDPKKDVDGFHPMSVGKMFLGEETFIPCTPYGVVYLLQHEGIVTKGTNVVIVGRSNIVGKPLSLLMLSKDVNATVTVCHSGTKDLWEITKKADILIAAIGSPQFIKKEGIKKGAVVIDVGVNRIADSSKKSGFRLVGDVDFEGASEIASMITPVPKGVGPMTIAMLIKNTLLATKRQNGIK